MAIRTLFLCTGNSARSQMAEHILKALGKDKFEVFSAGTEPRGVHPMTVQVLAESNMDAGNAISKGLDEFLGQQFDYTITVCDRTRDQCPTFPGDNKQIHWSFDDPAAEHGSETERLAVFRRVRNEINHRIRIWIAAVDK